MCVSGEIRHDEEMVPLAKFGDLRSAKKEKIKRTKACAT